MFLRGRRHSHQQQHRAKTESTRFLVKLRDLVPARSDSIAHYGSRDIIRMSFAGSRSNESTRLQTQHNSPPHQSASRTAEVHHR